ncbi:MAG: type II toxin-antitoxin system death-on-curing family toxin [Minicystis sp.]
MRYLTVAEVFHLHGRLLATTGGAPGIRDLGRVEAAVAAPKATFGGEDLYPGVLPKAATLCFSLVQGHAFVDGNKRIGHASMAVFLSLNGYTIDATVDDQERLILGIASGVTTRDELLTWLDAHARVK